MNINTNLSSLITQSSLKTSTLKLNQAIERMTTGCKINHAKDNAANYSISTNLSTKIGAYQVAQDNALMGLDMVQTTSSALSTMSDLTSRLRSLAMQAKNGTYGDKSISAINQEAASIINELYRIKSTTEYNGIKLFDSTPDPSNGVTLPDGTVLKPNSKGFLKDIVERDTSMMTALASVDENTALTSGVYSISTAEELAKLASMTNSGKIAANTEFVLAGDIDLGGYDNWTPIGVETSGFEATFDGNGHVVSNLHINSPAGWYQGLFGWCTGKIANLKLENMNIENCYYFAGAIGVLKSGGSITNCTVDGTASGRTHVGGITGCVSKDSSVDNCISYCDVSCAGNDVLGAIGGITGVSYGNISSCLSTGNITGVKTVGGIVGKNYNVVTTCFSSCNVKANSGSGGIVGNNAVGLNFIGEYWLATLDNCTFAGTVQAQEEPAGAIVGCFSGDIAGEILNCTYTNTGNQAYGSALVEPTLTNVKTINMEPVSLQVGINSQENSTISFNRTFLPGFNINLGNANSVDKIDQILAELNKKQVEYGAVENRLTSVLEQISIQYENLVSSRSTIQDADISEVSSVYIRQQILQQASATLMATANQSPAIALQLL